MIIPIVFAICFVALLMFVDTQLRSRRKLRHKQRMDQRKKQHELDMEREKRLHPLPEELLDEEEDEGYTVKYDSGGIVEFNGEAP